MRYYGKHEFLQELHANKANLQKVSCNQSLKLPLVEPLDFTNTSEFGFIWCDFDKIKFKDYNSNYRTVIDKYNTDFYLSAIFSEYVANTITKNTASIGKYNEDITFYGKPLSIYPAKNAIFKQKIVNDGTNTSTILDNTQAAVFYDATIIIDASTIAEYYNISIDDAYLAIQNFILNIQTYKDFNLPAIVQFIDKRVNKNIFRLNLDIINHVSFHSSTPSQIVIFIDNIQHSNTNYQWLDNYLDTSIDYTANQIIDITTNLDIIVNIFKEPILLNLDTSTLNEWNEYNFEIFTHKHHLTDLVDLKVNEPGGFLKLDDTRNVFSLKNFNTFSVYNLDKIVYTDSTGNKISTKPLLFEDILKFNHNYSNYRLSGFNYTLTENSYVIYSNVNYTTTDTTIGDTIYSYRTFINYDLTIDCSYTFAIKNAVYFETSGRITLSDATNFTNKYLFIGIDIDLDTFKPILTSRWVDKTIFDDATSFMFIDFEINAPTTLKNRNNKMKIQLNIYELNIVQPTPEAIPNLIITSIFSLFKDLDTNNFSDTFPDIIINTPGTTETRIKFDSTSNLQNIYVYGLNPGNSIRIDALNDSRRKFDIKYLKNNSNMILVKILTDNGQNFIDYTNPIEVMNIRLNYPQTNYVQLIYFRR